jgi:hypothetical protein
MKLGNQDIDKKISNMEEKFSKEMKIMENKQVEMVKNENLVSPIQTTVDSIISR